MDAISPVLVDAAEPFLVGGSAAVRLLTIRVREVLSRSAERVRVDEMARGEGHLS